MITIDIDAKRKSRLHIDIDNMRERYRTQSNIYTFPSPSLYTIEKNLFYLLAYSEEKQFEKKYSMRPFYLSFDEYGTDILWQVLMYVNGVFNIEEFDLNTVLVPKLSAIIAICEDKFSRDIKVDNLTGIRW